MTISALYALRSSIARTVPGVPAHYSFDQGLFRYHTTYSSGQVGPFSIGATKEQAMLDLERYGKSFIFPMEMESEAEESLYFTRQTALSPLARELLGQSESWRVSLEEQGATVVYDVIFAGGRIAQVQLFSTLLA